MTKILTSFKKMFKIIKKMIAMNYRKNSKYFNEMKLQIKRKLIAKIYSMNYNKTLNIVFVN